MWRYFLLFILPYKSKWKILSFLEDFNQNHIYVWSSFMKSLLKSWQLIPNIFFSLHRNLSVISNTPSLPCQICQQWAMPAFGVLLQNSQSCDLHNHQLLFLVLSKHVCKFFKMICKLPERLCYSSGAEWSRYKGQTTVSRQRMHGTSFTLHWKVLPLRK